jgi:hypothetical protein
MFYFVTLESRVRQVLMLKLFVPLVEWTNQNKFLFVCLMGDFVILFALPKMYYLIIVIKCMFNLDTLAIRRSMRLHSE